MDNNQKKESNSNEIYRGNTFDIKRGNTFSTLSKINDTIKVPKKVVFNDDDNQTRQLTFNSDYEEELSSRKDHIQQVKSNIPLNRRQYLLEQASDSVRWAKYDLDNEDNLEPEEVLNSNPINVSTNIAPNILPKVSTNSANILPQHLQKQTYVGRTFPIQSSQRQSRSQNTSSNFYSEVFNKNSSKTISKPINPQNKLQKHPIRSRSAKPTNQEMSIKPLTVVSNQIVHKTSTNTLTSN
jgi:hypothetical protein